MTIELPRRGTRQMLPEILTESKKRTKRRMQQFKERTQTNVVCDGCRNRVAFSSGRGRNLAAANSYSGPGADRGDDRGKIRHVSQPAEVLVGTEKI